MKNPVLTPSEFIDLELTSTKIDAIVKDLKHFDGKQLGTTASRKKLNSQIKARNAVNGCEKS